MGDGLKALTGGIGFVLGTPSAWPYALVPITLVVVLTCGLGGLGLWWSDWASRQILPETEGVAEMGNWLLTGLIGLAAVLGALVLALVLAQPLSGFALEAIALQQERALLGYNAPAPTFLAAVLEGVKAAVGTLTLGAFLFVILFLVDLAFPPAVAVTLPLRFLFGGWLLAWDFLDYPLSLRGHKFGARVAWFRANLTPVTAFGVGWAVLLLVPGLFLVVLPMGVAGATRLVVSRAAGFGPPSILPGSAAKTSR